jgi:plastocyanin
MFLKTTKKLMNRKLFKMMLIATGMLLVWKTSMATMHTVWVGDGADTFDPQTFTASVGDTVDWNWGFSGYNVESTTIPNGAAPWNSGVHSDPFHYSYVITVPGVYNYKDATHAGMTGSFTVTSTTSVGMVNTKPFSLSPSPAKDYVRFTGEVKSLVVEVYDLNGRRITNWVATNLSEKSFSVAELPVGLYMLSVNADSKRYSEKLVVTH